MTFEVDKQTLDDLEIFSSNSQKKSLLSLFNFTKYVGGKKKLELYLSTPSSDHQSLLEREEAIAYIQKYLISKFEIDKETLGFTEFYLKQAKSPTKQATQFASIGRFFNKLDTTGEYYITEIGVKSTIDLLKTVHTLAQEIYVTLNSTTEHSALITRKIQELLDLFKKVNFKEALECDKIKAYDSVRFDHVFRKTDKHKLLLLLDIIYEFDALTSVAIAADKYNLCYAEILPAAESCLEIDGLFHLFVDHAIANDIHFDQGRNLLFISGPNMAGKSTFLKAVGISVYLAHVGFPVPATRMKISTLSGLCTTINIVDNLSSGYSHFYAEVMRIKTVASKLSKKKNMLVIFDELFRGTNVKDAYDGTLAIVSAFSKVKKSFFIVSTHIVEVAEELKDNPKVKFCHCEVLSEEGQPKYTYKLQQGVSNIRLGMYIINREKLIEQINSIEED